MIEIQGLAPQQEVPLANVFVYLESVATPVAHRGGEARAPLTSASLFALSEGRRLSRTLGASLYALFFGTPLENKALEELAGLAAAYGADKLLVGEMQDAPTARLDLVWGPSFARVFERIPPALVLFPAGGSAQDLGPPLAARLGGTYAPRCEIKIDHLGPSAQDEGRVLLQRLRPDELSTRSLDPVIWEHPIVATLGPGLPPSPRPAIEIGVEILPCPPAEPSAAAEVVGDDPFAAWPFARLLVLVGAREQGADRGSDDAAARELASAINQSLAAQLTRGGGVVAAASDIPAAVLGATTARLIIKLGWSPARLPSLPGTRVAVVLEAAAPEPPDDRCDILLRLPEGEALDASLAGKLLQQLLGDESDSEGEGASGAWS